MNKRSLILVAGFFGIGTPAFAEDEPGYPLLIGFWKGECSFQVQDMIMKPADLRRWIERLPDKDWQIDLVSRPVTPPRCIEFAEETVRQAGFTKVEHVKYGERKYSSGLPPPPARQQAPDADVPDRR